MISTPAFGAEFLNRVDVAIRGGLDSTAKYPGYAYLRPADFPEDLTDEEWLDLPIVPR